MKKITYEKSGVSYQSLDPAKKLAQIAAKRTAKNLKKPLFFEIQDSRGESAYAWQQGQYIMASVIEGLGTKNLVADEMYKITGRTFYDAIGHDTVATVVNDLVSIGAKPLVINAYWAVGNDNWFRDKKRTEDLIKGWETGCNEAQVAWGGGETPALKGIVDEKTIELGGSAIGIIKNKNYLTSDKKISIGDRILLIKSNGINCNGLSLARSVAKSLPKGFQTKIRGSLTYGEALLTKTNIYANLIQDLQQSNIDIHYISNITGHGLRKIMRGRPEFTYVIEEVFKPQEIFLFIQKHAKLTDSEIYETLNMGQDFAIFVSPKDAKKAQAIIKKNKFKGLDAGYVEKGPRQVIIKPKQVTFSSQSLDLR
jgi:phosphoribosylformylglycinamidine cyclo-ligase